MVAVEDRMHEGTIDRPPVLGAELGELLRPLGERRAALSGPHRGVEGEPADELRVVLREQRRAQCARGDAVDEEGTLAAQALDVFCRRGAVLGAIGDRRIIVAGLGRAAVAFHIYRPSVVAVPGEELHRRRIRAPGHVEIEGRLRRHRGAVDEQDRPARLGRIAGALVPQEKLDLALGGPVFRAGQAVLQGRLVHEGAFPRSHRRRSRTCPTRSCALSKGLAELRGACGRLVTIARYGALRRKTNGRRARRGPNLRRETGLPTSACLACCTALSLPRFPPWNRSRFA